MRYLIPIPLVAALLLACCGTQTAGERTASTDTDGVRPSQQGKTAEASKQQTGESKVGDSKVAQGNGGATGSGASHVGGTDDQVGATAPRKEPQTEAEEEAAKAAGGWDASDLRAMRSAKQMLETEKRLKEMLKAGKIKGLDRILPFEEISSWQYQDWLKGIPKRLLKLDGKQVLMTGFMLPIDEVENIKEFLLVQSLWGCCYGTPPDINGVVRVVMEGSKRVNYEFEPIKVVGKFSVKPTIEDGFCVDIYQLSARSVEVIK